jgi:hypothetical protein
LENKFCSIKYPPYYCGVDGNGALDINKNNMNKEQKTKSIYRRWMDGEIGQFGSFHTALLDAYRLASSGNRELLEQVFPEWFLPKEEN